MKRKYTIIILLNLVVNLSIRGQNNSELPQVVPPAPNSSALAKYVEIPISTSTGIPSISIPLYSINEGDINVPLSLSYHASGIKVEEIASWVGLGWSLNAGGTISRTVRMNPDDMLNGYINTPYTVDHLASLPHSTAGQNDYYQINLVKEGLRDYEPDIFTFNFGNYNGRFIYDQNNNKFIQTPNNNLIIDPGYNFEGEIISFLITTENGLKFHFGKTPDGKVAIDRSPFTHSFSVEKNQTSISGEGPVYSYTSAWHLLLIESTTTGKSVIFNYQNQLSAQLYRNQESFISGNCDANGYSVGFSEVTENTSQLKNILFSNGKVEFVLDSQNRLDYLGGKALSEIRIFDKTKLIKSFKFENDYALSSSQTDNWSDFGNQSERLHRLRLISLTEENGSASHPPYIFGYNPILLPSRFSNGQDYWGYYNGKNNNQSLIPRVKLGGGSSNIFGGDADRSVDTLYSQAGMLSQITYPTGGDAQYHFESNKVSELNYHGGYLDLNLVPTISKQMHFVKSPVNLDPFGRYFKNFTISSNISSEPAKINTMVTGCDNTGLLTNFECDYLFQIIGVTDPTFSISISSSSFNYSFLPGDYKIVALDNTFSTNSDFSVIVDYEEISNSSPGFQEYIVGGQRIKKIVLNDGMGGTIERNYKYDFFQQGYSSGYSLGTPVFVDDEFFNGSCSPNKNVYKITSYSQSSAASVNGSSIGYENVTEFDKGILKTQYYFNKVGDLAHFSSGGVYGNVLLPDLYASWLRGNMIKKEEFTYNNNMFTLIKRAEHEYEAYNRQSISNSGVKMVMTISNGPSVTYKHGFYSAITEWYRLKNTTLATFQDSGDIISSTDYFYGINPGLVSKTVATSSDSKPIITKMFYPENVTNNYSLGAELLTSDELNAIKMLQAPSVINPNGKHRISQPIQVETYKDYNLNGAPEASELLSLHRTNYGISGSLGLVLPKLMKTLKGPYDATNSKLVKNIEYVEYDDIGNLLEFKKSYGVSEVYVWGYDKQYPIAKLENFETSKITGAVSSLITNAVSASDLDNDRTIGVSGSEGSLRTALNALREALPTVMVTTYTYDPLIGVTSITDPKGHTVYYDYDEFNRLKQVLDSGGNILSKNEYNYKN